MTRELFENCLNRNEIIIMDGGFGTQLNKYGIETELPLWSGVAALTAGGLAASRQIFLDALSVESDDLKTELVITPTFRTLPYVYRKVGLSAAIARQATLDACRVTREVRDEVDRPKVVIAGSSGPLEDCYTPSATPKELFSHHLMHAENLGEAYENGDIDYYLPETMITLRETRAALAVADYAGLYERGVSFCTDVDGQHLLSGEPLGEAVREAEKYDVSSVGVNCVKVSVATLAVAHLRSLTDLPIMVYAQGGEDASSNHTDDIKGSYREYYAEAAVIWRELGATCVGGCCGVTPECMQLVVEKLSKVDRCSQKT